jgi:hypothetical protein
MRTTTPYIRLYLPLILMTLFSFYFCTKNKGKLAPYPNTNTFAETVANDLRHGIWKVNSYHADAKEAPVTFRGYLFSFNANGAVSVSHNGATHNGSWDTDDNPPRLTLFFSMEPLDRISREWRVVESSASRLKLQLIREDGGVDELVLERV